MAYEVRIYPSASQRAQIERTFGAVRWVYNKCLETCKDAYEETGKSPTRWRLDKMLPGWKAEFPWLKEADSTALQSAVQDLSRAYDNFFRRCKTGGAPGYPRFKSKRDVRQSYRSKRVGGNAPMPEGAVPVMGVDAGIASLAALSTGEKVANPKAFARSEAKLAREQRRLSRKRRGSMRHAKQRVKVARVHERIADQRKDALHKATTKIVRESQAVAVEDLGVRGMERNRHLAKAVVDASISELTRQLGYKCAWHGRTFVKVSRWYPSSKTCSACGYVLGELPLSIRSWECPACGTRHDRDVNAAVNIAAEGARMLSEGTAGLAGTSGADATGTLAEQA